MPRANFPVNVTEPVSNSVTATFNTYTLTFSDHVFNTTFNWFRSRRRIIGTMYTQVVNGNWTEVVTFTTQDGIPWWFCGPSDGGGGTGGGTNVYIGITPPVNPNVGDLWFASDIGQLFVYYDDGSSAQWVVANSGSGGGAGGPVTVDNVTIAGDGEVVPLNVIGIDDGEF